MFSIFGSAPKLIAAWTAALGVILALSLVEHKHAILEVGDAHGGTGVSVPLEPRMAIGLAKTEVLCLGFGFLWLIGIGGIIVGSRQIRRRIHEQSKLFAMLASVEEGIAFADADGCITEVNQYLCRFANVTRERIVGRNMRDIHTPEVFERINQVLTKFKDNPGSEPVFV